MKDFPDTGHTPAHILGNMWDQDWTNLYDELQPFPGRAQLHITSTLKEQVCTA